MDMDICMVMGGYMHGYGWIDGCSGWGRLWVDMDEWMDVDWLACQSVIYPYAVAAASTLLLAVVVDIVRGYVRRYIYMDIYMDIVDNTNNDVLLWCTSVYMFVCKLHIN